MTRQEIKAWLKVNSISLKAFSAGTGISYDRLVHIMNGFRKANLLENQILNNAMLGWHDAEEALLVSTHRPTQKANPAHPEVESSHLSTATTQTSQDASEPQEVLQPDTADSVAAAPSTPDVCMHGYFHGHCAACKGEA